MKVILVCLFAVIACSHVCNHAQISKGHVLSVYDDTLEHRRNLQALNPVPIRIFADFSQVIPQYQQLPITSVIKKAVSITKTFFKRLLKVPPVSVNQYENTNPQKTEIYCNDNKIPPKFLGQNPQTVSDVDFYMIVNEKPNLVKGVIANSISCSKLKSTNRPHWGSTNFILGNIQQIFGRTFDQTEFQSLVYVSIHEFTHSLLFSTTLYDFYTPSIQYTRDAQIFTVASDIFLDIAKKKFNCSSSTLPLEKSRFDGVTYSSNHWHKRLVGDQLMIPTITTIPYISEFTIGLFEACGWYSDINRQFIEPSPWGKNKGCQILKPRGICPIQDCQDPQGNPTPNEFACSFQCHGKTLCKNDQFANCYLPILHNNQKDICLYNNSDAEKFGESRGRYSRCFKSTLRKKDIPGDRNNNRCFQSVCLNVGTRTMILLKIQTGQRLLCYYPGFTIRGPAGFQGDIRCPTDFDRICETKQVCPYGCGMNGTCINGKCLCDGASQLTQYCQPFQNDNLQTPSARRLLQETPIQRMLRIQESLDCPSGKIFDPIMNKCEQCLKLLNCSDCNKNGCISCEDGSSPIKGRCLAR